MGEGERLRFHLTWAHVDPAVIIGFLTRGTSWLDVTSHYGLTPEVFYVL
jgi:hypothetical protein